MGAQTIPEGGIAVNMLEILSKKRHGQALTGEEIGFFVRGVTDGSLPDYQISALLMALCMGGMSAQETADLTEAMAASGDTVDLTGIQGRVVDKHSTGGVGDTTSLIAVPWAAACGVKVGKMSGRGLGHTGGTLDKLEAIPGFSVEASPQDLVRLVNRNGCAIVGQSGDLDPADKKLYALRDVTATVDCLGLIASSIMSKKLAAGAQAIVLDVKAGSGAFMQDLEDAFALAREMVAIGERLGREVRAVVTDMNQPLGAAIGNALDVREAIAILRGEQPEAALLQVARALTREMLLLSGAYADGEAAEAALEEALRSGDALERLRRLIAAQGGDPRVCDNPALLPQARRTVAVPAPKAGYVTAMDTAAIGSAAGRLGAGRLRQDDRIDPAVGVMMQVRLGDWVEAGQPLATLHVNDSAHEEEAAARLRQAICLADAPVPAPPLLYGRVDRTGERRLPLP
jgi:pyrimidine-nucleoside phosphorylase